MEIPEVGLQLPSVPGAAGDRCQPFQGIRENQGMQPSVLERGCHAFDLEGVRTTTKSQRSRAEREAFGVRATGGWPDRPAPAESAPAEIHGCLFSTLYAAVAVYSR